MKKLYTILFATILLFNCKAEKSKNIDTVEAKINKLDSLQFDFTDYDIASVLQLQEQLLDHVSCSQG